METTVLYNGDCPICAREIAAYRARAERTGAPLAFQPLAAADLAAWGLTAEAAARRLHVRQGDRILAGVPAFRALWAALPGFRWLARVTGWPGVAGLTHLAYEHAAAPALYALHRRRVRRGLCARPPGA